MTYLSAEQAVTLLLTKQYTESIVLNESTAMLVNAVLNGAAHDIGCGCDNASIGHLYEWRGQWLDAHGDEVPEPRAEQASVDSP